MKHHEPPASAHIPHPARLMLHRLRPPAARYLQRRYRVQQYGRERVPLEGVKQLILDRMAAARP